LSVPKASLDASLACVGDLARGPHAPILLIPGTTVDPQEFTWNYMPAFRAMGWSFCSVTLPFHTTGDIQIAGEYVTNAIRTIYSRSGGRKIQIVGHSQGGMLSRWSLRFWPDTRPMVDDVTGVSPSNHGTVVAQAACVPDCPPADWQQENTSAFTEALNSVAETFPGVSYTNVYTHTDEIVVPNADSTGSSSLHTGQGRITNVAIQDVCPNDLTEHDGSGTYDNTAYQLVLDALTHDGPADPARVPTTACASPLMPGVNPVTFAADFANTAALLEQNTMSAPHSPSEPPLACYPTLRCLTAPPAAAARASSAGSGHEPAAPRPAAGRPKGAGITTGERRVLARTSIHSSGPTQPSRTLAFTGTTPLLALAGVVALGGAALARRRQQADRLN